MMTENTTLSLTVDHAHASWVPFLPSHDVASGPLSYTFLGTHYYLIQVGTRAGAWCCGNHRDSESELIWVQTLLEGSYLAELTVSHQ